MEEQVVRATKHIRLLIAALSLCISAYPAGATDFSEGFQRVDAEIRAEYVLSLREVKPTPEEIAKMGEQEVDYERRRSEVERSNTAMAWPPASERQCSATANGLGLCLRIDAPSTAAKGSPARYRVTWSEMPLGTRLDVWLESDAPLGDRWRYPELGPIRIPDDAREIVGSGSRSLTWNGKVCPIPRGDAIRGCRTVNPGRFRLKARAIRSASIGLQIAGWAQSEMLQLEGAPDISYLTRPWPALRSGLGHFLPRNFFFRRLMPAHQRGGDWCSIVEMPPPSVGNLDVCVPGELVDTYGIRARPGDVTYSGNYRLMPTLIAPDHAEIIAHRLARSLLEGQVNTTNLANIFDYEKWMVREKGLHPHSPEVRALNRLKWLQSEVKLGIYRHANEGYWLFEVYQRSHYFRHGEEGAPELPWETTLVKVERSGKACVVARGDLKIYRLILNEARWSPQESAVQSKIHAKGWDVPCSQRHGTPITL